MYILGAFIKHQVSIAVRIDIWVFYFCFKLPNFKLYDKEIVTKKHGIDIKIDS
jgi:hypothetical protein